MINNVFDIILFENYLKEKGLSESTIYVYSGTIKQFLDKNLDITSSESYNKFLIEHSIEKRTYNHYYALKLYIKWKIEDKKLRLDILKNLIRIKLKEDIVRERKHLKDEDLINLINFLQKEKHKIISIILLFTGVRAGDVLRLREGDIIIEEYEKKKVMKLNILGKGKKRKVVHIHNTEVISYILEYITRIGKTYKDFYFLDNLKFTRFKKVLDSIKHTEMVNYRKYWNDLRTAVVSLGYQKKDFSTHDFRRCFARKVWEKWKDVYVLQNMLGHKDPKVTFRYLRQSGLQNIDYYKELQ